MKRIFLCTILLTIFLTGCNKEIVLKESINQKVIGDINTTTTNSNVTTKENPDLLWENKEETFQEKTLKLDSYGGDNVDKFESLYSFNSKTFTKTKYNIPYLNTIYALSETYMVYRGTDNNIYLAHTKEESIKKILDLNKEDYFNSYSFQNDIFYFQTSDFFGKLNMITGELDKVDAKPYYSMVKSMLNEDFIGNVYTDSKGIYFLSSTNDNPGKFIGINWNKYLLFIQDSCDPIHITKNFIWLEDYTVNLLYKHTKYGHMIDSTKLVDSNGYYKYVADQLYYVDDNSITFIESSFNSNKFFSSEDSIKRLSIIQNKDKILCVLENEILAFDKDFELLYKIKKPKKWSPITENHLNIQNDSSVITYSCDNILSGNHLFLSSKDYENEVLKLSVLNLLTEELYHIDNINASWLRETFVIGDIIYYFPES